MQILVNDNGEADVRLGKKDKLKLSRALNLVRVLATNGQDSLADDCLEPLTLLARKYGAVEKEATNG